MRKNIVVILIIIMLVIAIRSTLEVKVYFNEFKNNYLVEIRVLNIRIFEEAKDIDYINEFEDIEEFNLEGVV